MANNASLVSPANIFARPRAEEEIWLGPAQRAALSHIFDARGHKLVSGPPSCGKSTLLRYAASSRPNVVGLSIEGPRKDAADVLTGLLASAGLAPWELSETDQRNLLILFIQQRRAQRKRVVVLVDDPQRFAPEARREIERLCLPRDGSEPLLEITAVGPPVPDGPFDFPAPPSRHSMPALGGPELREYLHWRFARFELPFRFTDDALDLVERICGGRYGAVDALCRMALLLNRDSPSPIDVAEIREAVQAYAARRRASATRHEQAAPAVPSQRARSGGRIAIMHNGKVVGSVVLRERLLLGRSLENDVSLASSAVSRFHAAIVGTPERFFVVDLDSTNGVLLNGTRVGKVELCDQDIVSIGPFQLRVLLQQPAAPSESADDPEKLVDTAVMARRADSPPMRLVKTAP